MRMRQTHKRTWTHTRGDGQAKTGEEERERERDEEKKDEDEDGKTKEMNPTNSSSLAQVLKCHGAFAIVVSGSQF